MEDISDSPKFNKNYRLTSINLDLISINAGGFSMGSSYHDRDEKPTHTVKLHEPFWIGKYEVTQDQYKGLMKINPSAIKGGSNPVDSVSWIDASKFCAVLNNLETKIIPQGYEFRLPTEAEWEYCAKAGKEKYDIDENNNICWHKYNSDKKHHKAGSKSSNPWGIYDMLGNVWEWVHDSYDSDFYSKSSNLRTFSNKGKDKVIRGGSWYDLQRFCRPGNRNHYNRDVSGDILGFRIVLAPKL
jgi:formylglycine-generating enzyme required for sulfatase activity